MRALVFDRTLRLDGNYPRPEPGEGETLVRVLKAGICNTDLELVKGYMGFSGVLGHEFVGVVEGGAWDGRRVAGEINLSCWACDVCLAGLDTHCPHRTTLGIDRHDGAFAEWLTLPPVNLHPLPDSVADDEAVFVEPLAAGLQTLHLTHISPHDRVVLLGAGKLGLLTAQVVALTGCDLTVIGRHAHQRDLIGGWGIHAAAPGEVEPNSADTVIDCTGSESGFADALELVRPRGTIHLKSTYHGLPQADLTRVVVDEVQVVSSRCGPFDAAIRLLSRGLVDVKSLIAARYPLDEGLAAMEHAARKGVLKVILDIA
jgi:alcohol dehydrogenase